jgi:hypothetical protein
MMSAGLIGSPGLGYFKDRYTGEALQQSDPTLYDQYKAQTPSKFLVFPEATGLDGKKLGAVQEKLATARAKMAETGNVDPLAAYNELTAEERAVHQASITGDRRTLIADSAIPATMALIYLGLLLYFKSIGGYKPVSLLHEEHKLTEWAAGEG